MSDLRDFIAAMRKGEDDPSGQEDAVREKRRAGYRNYYYANPQQTLKDQARQSAYQSTSEKTADSHGERWTSESLENALMSQRPIMAIAQETGRTYAAIRQARYRLRRGSN